MYIGLYWNILDILDIIGLYWYILNKVKLILID